MALRVAGSIGAKSGCNISAGAFKTACESVPAATHRPRLAGHWRKVWWEQTGHEAAFVAQQRRAQARNPPRAVLHGRDRCRADLPAQRVCCHRQPSITGISSGPAGYKWRVASLPEQRMAGGQTQPERGRKLPVLLFDVMDTLIRDPFYEDMPKFFQLSLKELFAVKHPTAWIEFETGLISEKELVAKFFKDGRDFDMTGLKGCAYEGYRWIDGCEDLLRRLQAAGYEAHAFTNYPDWYKMIEEKLLLSRYLDWTFVSCQTGRRKPDPEAFLEAVETLGLEPRECLFIDDRLKNVEAAHSIGIPALLFENAVSLERKLVMLGVQLEQSAVLDLL